MHLKWTCKYFAKVLRWLGSRYEAVRGRLYISMVSHVVPVLQPRSCGVPGVSTNPHRPDRTRHRRRRRIPTIYADAREISVVIVFNFCIQRCLIYVNVNDAIYIGSSLVCSVQNSGESALGTQPVLPPVELDGPQRGHCSTPVLA